MHYRRQSKVVEGIKVGLFLLGIVILLAVVAGKAFDDGYESRCQVWGTNTTGCAK